MSETFGTGNARPARDSFFQSLQRKWGIKAGRIADLLVSPCHANVPGGEATNIMLWVLAAFAAVPGVIQSFNTHDCSDNLWDKNKQLWLPTPGRGGGRHGRRGTPQNSGGSYHGPVTPQMSGWQQAAFRLGDMTQKLGALLTIVDAALDFGINWQSMWMEWNGCGAPPPVFTTATVARDVVGCVGGDLRNDLAGHPGSVGIVCGIGGFATTVPVGNLEMAGSVGDRQFLWKPYAPLGGTYWVVDAVGGGSPPILDQRATYAPGTNANTAQHGSRASMNTLTSSGRTGSIMIVRPQCPVPNDGGCQVDPGNIVTIMGESAGLLFADTRADPCGNLPLTGTGVRR